MNELDNPSDNVSVKEVILEKFEYYVATQLTGEMADTLIDSVDVMEGFFGDIMLRMRGYVWSDPPKTWRVEHPLTWWDAVKTRFAPAWFLARWPAQMKVHEMEIRTLYDEMNVQLPDKHHIMRVAFRDNTDDWDGDDTYE